MDDVPDFGFEDSIIDPATNRIRNMYNILNSNIFELTTSGPTHTENNIIFCSPTLGFFWIFNTETGRLYKLAKIYESVNELIKKSCDVQTVVACWQPQQNGNILIANRSESVVINHLRRRYVHHKSAVDKTIEICRHHNNNSIYFYCNINHNWIFWQCQR